MVSQTAAFDHFEGHNGVHYTNDTLKLFGTHECHSFRERIFDKHFRLSRALRSNYHAIAANDSHVSANINLRHIDDQLTVNGLSLLSTHDRILQVAENQAKYAANLNASNSDNDAVYQLLAKSAKAFRLTPPLPRNFQQKLEPCINRLCCVKWWSRQLTRLQRITIESVSREIQQVHHHKSMYCSSLTLQLHRQQKNRNREYMEAMTAINENGQEFTLQQLSDVSVSNPKLRRLELITRCKGFEVAAKAADHIALFITLTCPSRFHRVTKITNGSKVIKVIPNKNFDGSCPREAQNYLQNQWAKIGAKLKRNYIKPYGFRVAEPHHDGTPHWHFLLFIEKDKRDQLISIFTEYALQDSPNEKGAKKHRLKIEDIKSGINPKTGKEYSATGYIIKYICKSIDGHGIDNSEISASGKDWEEQNPLVSAEKIEAWARTYRIRQFQQIGGPSVTVWRELRRLGEQEGQLEKIRQAADKGDWAEFISLMGGANLKRDEYALSPAYAASERIDMDSGEIIEVTHTQYGDEAKERVIGILLAGAVVMSRCHIWQIKDNPRLRTARQQVMNGIINILDEIQQQNDCLIPEHLLTLQEAQPPALDLGIFSTFKIIEVITMDAAAVTTITNAVDFATIITGIGTIAASVALVLISVKGAKMLLSMIRGG